MQSLWQHYLAHFRAALADYVPIHVDIDCDDKDSAPSTSIEDVSVQSSLVKRQPTKLMPAVTVCKELGQPQALSTSEFKVAKQVGSQYKLPTAAQQVQQLKEFFRTLFTEDCLDMSLYQNMCRDQKAVVVSIIKRRFKESLLGEMTKCTSGKLPTFSHILKKRVDHCEKSAMTVMISTLREKQKLLQSDEQNPQPPKENINLKLFRRFFPSWVDPFEPVQIYQSECDQQNEKCRKPKQMSRINAAFCIKMGLTGCWSRVVSTRLLKGLLSITSEEMRIYYVNKKISIKLEEIFGGPQHVNDDEDNLRCYYTYLREKIEGKKFKLPLSNMELQECEQLARSRIKNQFEFTSCNEREEFKNRYGDIEYIEKHVEWSSQELPELPKLTQNCFRKKSYNISK